MKKADGDLLSKMGFVVSLCPPCALWFAHKYTIDTDKLAHLPVRTFQVVAGSQTCHSFRLSGLRTRQHMELYLLVLLDIKKEIPIRSSYKAGVNDRRKVLTPEHK